jgi:hypothetical protein
MAGHGSTLSRTLKSAPYRFQPAGMFALGMSCLTCLLMISCEKPESEDSLKDTTATQTRSTRAGHVPRKPVQGSLAELRKILKTAADIESPAAREKAIADVAWNALETDPDLAVKAFLQLPTGSPEKIRLIQHYAMRLAEQNPDEALAWAATLESEEEISAAHSQIALALAETDPQRAANLLSESGIVSREFDVTVVQVVQRWAAQSPPETAAWVAMFPPGPAREAGIKIIADRWLQADPQAAFSWLAELKDAGVRKEAALGMEESILQQPGDIRDTWLQHADDSIRSELEQQRERAVEEVGDNIPPPQSWNAPLPAFHSLSALVSAPFRWERIPAVFLNHIPAARVTSPGFSLPCFTEGWFAEKPSLKSLEPVLHWVGQLASVVRTMEISRS